MEMINRFSIPNLMRRREVMAQLNCWSITHLFVDLVNIERTIIPHHSWAAMFRYLMMAINLIRFVFFSLRDRSTYESFLFGNCFFYIGGTRLLSAVVVLVDVVFLYSHYVAKKHLLQSADYKNTISYPMGESLLDSGTTTRRLIYCGDLCTISAIVIGFGVDILQKIMESVENHMTPATFLYSLFWSSQSGMDGALVTSSVVTYGLFLRATCKYLRSFFKRVQLMVMRLSEREEKPQVEKVLKAFNKACTEVKKFDEFWKKILFLNVIGYTITCALILQMGFFAKVHFLVKVALTATTLQIMVVVSYLILSPASVNAAARGLHNQFSSLLARNLTNIPRRQRCKMNFTMKRFINPIAFTLWDSNYLEYYDYYQFIASLLSNFFLFTKLLSKMS